LTFAATDLIDHCHADASEAEKKHRSRRGRPAQRIVDADPDWPVWRSHAQGAALVFFNRASAQSLSLAQLWFQTEPQVERVAQRNVCPT